MGYLLWGVVIAAVVAVTWLYVAWRIVKADPSAFGGDYRR